MQVLMVGAEMAPYSKVGGLGDVLGALPQALSRLGCDVAVVLPFSLAIDAARWGIRASGVEVLVDMDGASRPASVLEAPPLGGVRVWFVDYPAYFHREGLYGTAGGDHPDNPQRFAFFARAALEAARILMPTPDVVHSHDWQAGLVPFYLKAPDHLGTSAQFQGTATIHTVHNLSYQGLFPAAVLPSLGISWDHFHYRALEFFGLVNFLKAGLVFADAITTVSETYAREIQTPEYAWGLHGVLSERREELFGIVNGIDTASWDPANDGAIPSRYSAQDLRGRAKNTRELRREVGLPADRRPLVGLVNRLVAQKGIDFLLNLETRIEELGLQWVILGSGDRGYEAAVAALASRHPDTLVARIGFDDGLARRIYAGSDLFCMPSYFEPCGLGQMIAMRYGSLPVVRRTGGLADTVRDVDQGEGVGFLFEEATSLALEGALQRARRFLVDPRRRTRARKRAMAMDFSWEASARRYLDLYRRVGSR